MCNLPVLHVISGQHTEAQGQNVVLIPPFICLDSNYDIIILTDTSSLKDGILSKDKDAKKPQ